MNTHLECGTSIHGGKLTTIPMLLCNPFPNSQNADKPLKAQLLKANRKYNGQLRNKSSLALTSDQPFHCSLALTSDL